MKHYPKNVVRRARTLLALAVACMLPAAALYAQDRSASEPIKPLPPKPALDAKKVELGRLLFNDARFSDDGSVSCASCHKVEAGGADAGRKLSVGVRKQSGTINSPSVLTAAYNFRQFWDGRADTLENQIPHVLSNPREFGSTWPAVVARLSADPKLVGAVKEVYGTTALSQRNLSDAIATYERSLPEPSRFDQYLRGDSQAITEDERQGYVKFKSYGCIACHQGVNVGGNMYQRLGVLGDYFNDRGGPLTTDDMGRFNVTRRESDRHVFKVPSLRNVALTPPYFHDGSATTLEQAVQAMFKYQLGRSAPPQDAAQIVQFLRALTAQSIEKNQRGATTAATAQASQKP
ncbi:MAG: c-type cytochrome [Burkholderiaceae bacterium]|jgi:cytochrome c peroxidase|nr:c-type cytochrome [Burkholderiaceae bacterium]